MESPRTRAFHTASSRGLRADDAVRRLRDDLAEGDHRRIRKHALQLLVTHPTGREPSRLVGVRRRVEEAERGDDTIIGDDNPQDTFDVMRGQAGDDTLVWNPGDDDDINEGGADDDTSQVNGGGKEQFEVNPSATPGRVLFERVQPDGTFAAPFKVDISDDTERLDLNAGGGDDIVNAAAGLDALAFALDIDGGDGNDVIDGGDGADLLSGDNGNDTITADDNPVDTQDIVRGGDGDDTMVWNGGDDNDVNEGGPGNDTAQVNGAAVGEQFTVKPSLVTAGGVRFDRTGAPGPFNIEISGDTERLDLNASGGEDSVTADPGFTSRPLRPVRIRSTCPPSSVATTGRPAYMASCTTMPRPSCRDEST